jgi:hypothetical protein
MGGGSKVTLFGEGEEEEEREMGEVNYCYFW